MQARSKQTKATLRHLSGCDPIESALHYARNVYVATERRMPEARARAIWLAQMASAFGFTEAALPDDEALHRTARRAISLRDWRNIGAVLDEAGTRQQTRRNTPVGHWFAKIAATLALDPWEIEIFALAVQYQLDQRIRRLFDILSDARGARTRFQKDAALIGLLLKASTAAVDLRLAPDARLQASGLLRVERHGELTVLERLTSLMRRDISPQEDLYEQLLGKITTDPLTWDSFAHLGREAEVAANVLRAALAQQERGVNILLYGPPGTGKTSFAAALAAQIRARLRPVIECDDDGGEPTRYERLAGLRLAQRLSASRNTLLLFDEAEDLFLERGAVLERQPSRVFMHRMLEQVTVPVIWTANDIRALGSAVLRRMTMCRTRSWRRERNWDPTFSEFEARQLAPGRATGIRRHIS
jgi:hypothetical protein